MKRATGGDQDSGNSGQDFAGNRSQLVKELRAADPILRGRFDDSDVLDMAMGIVMRNPAYERAFMDRADNPGIWRSVAREVAGEIGGRLQRLRMGHDRPEAERQAEDAKVMAMSDSQRIQYWKSKGIHLGL